MKNLMILVAAVAVVTASWSIAAPKFAEGQAMLDAEHAFIAEEVSKGTPRSAIHCNMGECEVNL